MGAGAGKGAKELDVLHWAGRTALELVGQGAFGYSFDPLDAAAPPPDAFAESVKSFLCVVSCVTCPVLLQPLLT